MAATENDSRLVIRYASAVKASTAGNDADR